jgi:hypothetical protein
LRIDVDANGQAQIVARNQPVVAAGAPVGEGVPGTGVNPMPAGTPQPQTWPPPQIGAPRTRFTSSESTLAANQQDIINQALRNQTNPMAVNGSVNLNVTAPRGTKIQSDTDGQLFRTVDTKRTIQMDPSSIGPHEPFNMPE